MRSACTSLCQAAYMSDPGVCRGRQQSPESASPAQERWMMLGVW
jgi:hypothetical protein